MRGMSFNRSIQDLLTDGQLTVDEIAKKLRTKQRSVKRVQASMHPRPLTDAIVYSVQQRIANGQFESAISASVGVSRSIVKRINSGEITTPVEGLGLMTHAQPSTPRDRGQGQLHHHRDTSTRCTSCGGLVYGDCTLCIIRESIARGGVYTNVAICSDDELRDAAAIAQDLDIRYTLAPEHLARALEIREKNEADGNRILARRKPR